MKQLLWGPWQSPPHTLRVYVLDMSLFNKLILFITAGCITVYYFMVFKVLLTELCTVNSHSSDTSTRWAPLQNGHLELTLFKTDISLRQALVGPNDAYVHLRESWLVYKSSYPLKNVFVGQLTITGENTYRFQQYRLVDNFYPEKYQTYQDCEDYLKTIWPRRTLKGQ